MHFGTIDAPLVRELRTAWVEAQDVATVCLGHTQRAVALIPEHAVRARQREGDRPQHVTCFGIHVLDLVCAGPADPQRAARARTAIELARGRARMQFGLLLSS